MILCKSDIKKAIRIGDLVITPQPEESQYSTSALDLRVGPNFYKFKNPDPAIETILDFDLLKRTAESYKILKKYIEPVIPNEEGVVIIKQDGFILMETYEKIQLPLEGQLASRVEGRSSLARLGISVHMTAPTIQCGFSGTICLEVKNQGPFHMKIWPKKTRICQVVFEKVSSRPHEELDTIFMNQEGPTGKK